MEPTTGEHVGVVKAGRTAAPRAGGDGVLSVAGTPASLTTDEQIVAAYRQLRAFAAAMLRNEADGHTLQPTALVHEAWARLARNEQGQWRDAGSFFAIATRAMEQVLVDHARRKASLKRGGPGAAGRRRPIGEIEGLIGEDSGEPAVEVEALSAALSELESYDPRAAELVRLRFFCGMQVEQAAAVLKISGGSAERDWRMARAWLADRLESGGSSPNGIGGDR